ILEICGKAGQSVGRRFVGTESNRPVEPISGGIQAGVLIIWRATPFHDRLRLTARVLGDVLFDYMNQPGFADARLAHQQDNLAHSLLGLIPTVAQEADFLIATDERREAGHARHVDTALRFAWAQYLEHFDGLWHPLDGMAPQASADEEPMY